MNVHSAPSLARAGALVVALAGVSACAPGSSVPPAVSQQAGAAPILLSCPAGQQPLLRQVLVNGAPVSQVECVAAGAAVPGAAAAALTPAPMTSVPQGYATIPTPMAPMAASVAPTVPYAVPAAEDRGGLTAPRARRVVYDDDVVEYRPAKKGRSVKKSLLIIGSSAGVGAGVGAATGGKKGALIGAAIGGGAATVWDQVTRR